LEASSLLIMCRIIGEQAMASRRPAVARCFELLTADVLMCVGSFRAAGTGFLDFLCAISPNAQSLLAQQQQAQLQGQYQQPSGAQAGAGDGPNANAYDESVMYNRDALMSNGPIAALMSAAADSRNAQAHNANSSSTKSESAATSNAAYEYAFLPTVLSNNGTIHAGVDPLQALTQLLTCAQSSSDASLQSSGEWTSLRYWALRKARVCARMLGDKRLFLYLSMQLLEPHMQTFHQTHNFHAALSHLRSLSVSVSAHRNVNPTNVLSHVLRAPQFPVINAQTHTQCLVSARSRRTDDSNAEDDENLSLLQAIQEDIVALSTRADSLATSSADTHLALPVHVPMSVFFSCEVQFPGDASIEHVTKTLLDDTLCVQTVKVFNSERNYVDLCVRSHLPADVCVYDVCVKYVCLSFEGFEDADTSDAGGPNNNALDSLDAAPAHAGVAGATPSHSHSRSRTGSYAPTDKYFIARATTTTATRSEDSEDRISGASSHGFDIKSGADITNKVRLFYTPTHTGEYRLADISFRVGDCLHVSYSPLTTLPNAGTATAHTQHTTGATGPQQPQPSDPAFRQTYTQLGQSPTALTPGLISPPPRHGGHVSAHTHVPTQTQVTTIKEYNQFLQTHTLIQVVQPPNLLNVCVFAPSFSPLHAVDALKVVCVPTRPRDVYTHMKISLLTSSHLMSSFTQTADPHANTNLNTNTNTSDGYFDSTHTSLHTSASTFSPQHVMSPDSDDVFSHMQSFTPAPPHTQTQTHTQAQAAGPAVGGGQHVHVNVKPTSEWTASVCVYDSGSGSMRTVTSVALSAVGPAHTHTHTHTQQQATDADSSVVIESIDMNSVLPATPGQDGPDGASSGELKWVLVLTIPYECTDSCVHTRRRSSSPMFVRERDPSNSGKPPTRPQLTPEKSPPSSPVFAQAHANAGNVRGGRQQLQNAARTDSNVPITESLLAVHVESVVQRNHCAMDTQSSQLCAVHTHKANTVSPPTSAATQQPTASGGSVCAQAHGPLRIRTHCAHYSASDGRVFVQAVIENVTEMSLLLPHLKYCSNKQNDSNECYLTIVGGHSENEQLLSMFGECLPASKAVFASQSSAEQTDSEDTDEDDAVVLAAGASYCVGLELTILTALMGDGQADADDVLERLRVPSLQVFYRRCKRELYANANESKLQGSTAATVPDCVLFDSSTGKKNSEYECTLYSCTTAVGLPTHADSTLLDFELQGRVQPQASISNHNSLRVVGLGETVTIEYKLIVLKPAARKMSTKPCAKQRYVDSPLFCRTAVGILDKGIYVR
jgi:hypothetical protein